MLLFFFRVCGGNLKKLMEVLIYTNIYVFNRILFPFLFLFFFLKNCCLAYFWNLSLRIANAWNTDFSYVYFTTILQFFLHWSGRWVFNFCYLLWGECFNSSFFMFFIVLSVLYNLSCLFLLYVFIFKFLKFLFFIFVFGYVFILCPFCFSFLVLLMAV